MHSVHTWSAGPLAHTRRQSSAVGSTADLISKRNHQAAGHRRNSTTHMSQDSGGTMSISGPGGGGGGDNNRLRSVGLDSSLKNYINLIASAGDFMRDEIEKLPLRKYEYVHLKSSLTFPSNWSLSQSVAPPRGHKPAVSLVS